MGRPGDDVLTTVKAAAKGVLVEAVLLGDNDVTQGSFIDNGIEDNATLTVVARRCKATIVQIVDAIIRCNPHVTRSQMFEGYKGIRFNHEDGTVESWDIS